MRSGPPAGSRRLSGRATPAVPPPAPQTLARFIGGGGRIAVNIHRGADITRLLRWSKQRGVNIALALTAANGLRAYLAGDKSTAIDDLGTVAEEIAARAGLKA